jgi:hypothetical protein
MSDTPSKPSERPPACTCPPGRAHVAGPGEAVWELLDCLTAILFKLGGLEGMAVPVPASMTLELDADFPGGATIHMARDQETGDRLLWLEPCPEGDGPKRTRERQRPQEGVPTWPVPRGDDVVH